MHEKQGPDTSQLVDRCGTNFFKYVSIVNEYVHFFLEIYEALNHFIAFDKLPKIWKNIRDRYQKIKKDMDKDGRTSKPRYRYYDMLRFLDDVDCSGVMDDK